MCLVARHLERAGIPTVILGSALDIVEHCGAPRYAFTDFPLGNPCGKPYDADMQRDIVRAAVSLLEEAEGPRALIRSPFVWGSDEWREGYMRIRTEDVKRLAAAGAARRAHRQALRERGQVRAG